MTESTSPLVEFVEVTKRYGPRLILDRVSLCVRPGETVAVIGPSGGGKSTLLRCANGLTPFENGTVRVGDHQLSAAASPRERSRAAREMRRLVGLVFQNYQLFPHWSALDNVAAGPRFVLGWTKERAREQARLLLGRVGLAQRLYDYPSQLSGGQQQRVAIARALALEPRVLLCDEVTSALDPELKQEVLAVLRDLRQDGLALLMVTHEIRFSRRAADRVVVLADGRVLEEGPPEEVLERPRQERTRKFLADVLSD